MKISRPNVIVVLTDQQRWDTTGLHGNPLDLTPNLDEMGRRGTHVRHAFTPQPLCGPARACMQTGLYPTASGCFRNDIPLPTSLPTMAQAFSAAGYRTGYIGKWHLADSNVAGPVRREQRAGYNDWLASNILEMTSDAYDTRLYDADDREIRLPGYRVDALMDAAIRFVDSSNTGVPFFLFLSFLEPHHQNHRDDFPAPAGYASRYHGRWLPPDLAAIISATTGMAGGNAQQHLAGYLGMIKRLDEALGRLLDVLRSNRLERNTIVCFTSDHGCHFKTRNEEYKRSGHEASIRIPLALCGPGFDGGGAVQELVSLVDLPPTLLDAAGVRPLSPMQGRSFMPLLRQEKIDWPSEVLIQISESEVGRAIRTKRWKYGCLAAGTDPYQNARSERYRESYLYDLESDPYELTNLIEFASHAELASRLSQRLIQRMVAVGEPPAQIDHLPHKPGGQRRVEPSELEL